MDEWGIDLNILSRHTNKTALYLANHNNHGDIVSLLYNDPRVDRNLGDWGDEYIIDRWKVPLQQNSNEATIRF